MKFKKLVESFSSRDEEIKVSKSLHNYLKSENIYTDLCEFYGNELIIEINWGDWKHEHLRTKLIVPKWVEENTAHEVVNITTDVTEEDGSDVYSARHIFKLKEVGKKVPLSLTEARISGEDTIRIARAVNDVFKNSSNSEKSQVISTVIDAVPPSLIDEVFDSVDQRWNDLKLSAAQKAQLAQSTDGKVDADQIDTLGTFLDLVDPDSLTKNPELMKSIVLTVLGIVSIIEPTPVGELITLIISALPPSAFATLTKISSFFNPIAHATKWIKNKRKEKATV